VNTAQQVKTTTSSKESVLSAKVDTPTATRSILASQTAGRLVSSITTQADCKLPNFWREDVKRCFRCQGGHEYNTETQKCVTCPAGFVYNRETNKCRSSTTTNGTTNGTTTTNGSSSSSTSGTVNGGATTTVTTRDNCLLPRYWNIPDSKCEYCPTGQNYDIVQRKCLVC
jgi:hypothetical protein